ncbi:MAG TPA: alcohol dehydrogenase catalytic domain-containing protein [Bryobacteraceae bacterium]|nr:alcohol dehydrogenase catalytic domain-containing protein [Bryobacteraceae bacterium]
MNGTRSYRAAVFAGPAEGCRIERYELPTLASGDVLVRAKCCTLCSSDLHTYHGRRTSPAPSILGHEVIGVVEDTGGCETFRRGDRVTWSIAASCGECRLCRRGLPQKCSTLFKYGHERFLSGDKPSGGLSEYCVLRAGTAMFAVPETLSDAVAATANCAAATVMAVLRLAGNIEGKTVLVQGAGILGLYAALAAQESGADVVLLEPDPSRSAKAVAFGIKPIQHGDAVGLRDQVADLTKGQGVDVALEFSGRPEAVEEALPLLGVGAAYVLAGAVFPARPAAVDLETVVRKLVRVQGVHNYAPQDLAAAIPFLVRQVERYP